MWENFSSTIPPTICGLRWTNQVVSHHHHRRSQPAELAWGSVGLGKQLDPYRGSEGRADPIWLSVEVLCR